MIKDLMSIDWLNHEQFIKFHYLLDDTSLYFLLLHQRDLTPYVNNLPLSVGRALLEYDPNFLEWINDPSDELCKIAIDQNPYNLRHIINPTDDIVQYARNKMIESEDTINPYLTVGVYVDYLRTSFPHREKLLEFDDRISDPSCINDFASKYKSLSEEEIKFILTVFPTFIGLMENPSVDLMNFSILQNRNAFDHIKDPPEEVCYYAISQEPYLIRYIKNPSNDMIMAALKQNAMSLQYIKKPTKEQLQFAKSRLKLHKVYKTYLDLYLTHHKKLKKLKKV